MKESTVYRATPNSDFAKHYKVFYKGKELKGVVAIEYYPEMNL